jgi:hypothetical protein
MPSFVGARHTLERQAMQILGKPLSPDNKLNLIDAIEKIANETTRPLSQAELRQRLYELGLPKSSFNNYFHTAIRRLRARGRITVFDDGRVWRMLSPCGMSSNDRK